MSTPPKTEKEPKFPENFVQKVERLGASVRAATDPTAGITQADIQTFNEQTANQLKDLKPFDAFTKRKRVIDNVAHLEKNLDDTDDNRKIKEALKKLREETQKLQLLGGKFGANRVENLVAAPINTIMQMPTTIERSPVLGVVAGLAISLPIALWIMNKVRGRSSSLLRTMLYMTGMVTLAAGVIAIMGNPAQKAAAEELVQKQKQDKVAKLSKETFDGVELVNFNDLPANLIIAQNADLLKDMPRTYVTYNNDGIKEAPLYFYKENGELRAKISKSAYRITAKNIKDEKEVEVPAIRGIIKDVQGGIVISGPLAKNGDIMAIRLSAEQLAGLAREGDNLEPKSFTSEVQRDLSSVPTGEKRAALIKDIESKYGGRVDTTTPGKAFAKIPISITFDPIADVLPVRPRPLS